MPCEPGGSVQWRRSISVCCVSLDSFSFLPFPLPAVSDWKPLPLFSVRSSGTESSRERNGHSFADKYTRKHVQKFIQDKQTRLMFDKDT